MLIDIVWTVIINQTVLWSIIGLIYIFLRKKAQINQTEEEDQEDLNPLEQIVEVLGETITSNLDLDKITSEVSQSVVNSVKAEMALLVNSPEVQKQANNFINSSLVGVMESHLPDIITETVVNLFSQQQQPAEGEGGEGQPQMVNPMDLANIDIGQQFKLLALQYVQDMVSKQRPATAALPAESHSISSSQEAW